MMETTHEENMGNCSAIVSPALVVIYGPLFRIEKQAGVDFMTMILEQKTGIEMGEVFIKIYPT